MDLALHLNLQDTTPLHQQLYEQIRDAILSGRLPPEQRLPASRALAQSLQVSRSTISLSYDRLLSEGYLETRVGSGTFVCAQLPETLLQAGAIASSPSIAPTTIQLSDYGQRLTAQPAWQPEERPEIHFRYGRSDMDLFPLALWRKLQSRHMAANRQWMDYTQDTLGSRPLREAIAQYLARSRAVRCHPDQVLITHGTQQAVQLIAQLLINPGDTIALENPGYVSSRKIFQARGAKVLSIPVDSDGIQIERLEQQCRQSTAPVRLVFVTPSHQFPTGALLPLSRRLQLLTWARQNGALIIEDDYDSEYRYSSRPIPALQGLEAQSPVLYIGTFAKMLFPGLRIGYLVVPEANIQSESPSTNASLSSSQTLIDVFGQARWLSDRHSSLLDQAILTDFITEGHLERHIRRMRLCYARRQRALVNALEEAFGNRVQFLGAAAGLHILVQFDLGLSHEAIHGRARAAGIGLENARLHYSVGAGMDESASEGKFILGYAELDEAAIALGIQRLAAALS